MIPLALALNSALLHLVWQGAVVAFLLWIVLAALRNGSPGARYLASCTALGILALLPVMTTCLVYRGPREIAGVEARFVTVIFASPVSEPANWLALAQAWMLPAWACGVALLSIRLLWGYANVSALKRTGDPAEPAVLAMVSRMSERLGVTRTVSVLISSLAGGPSVVGCLKPVILLPAATLLGLTPEQLEAILAHELAHIRRYDYLVNVVQMLIETLFFYHPAVWWISSRIRQERELCCDDMAVRACGDAVGYARALTALERMRVMSPSLALGVKDGPLMYRIQRLLGATPREDCPSRLLALVAILLAVASLPAGMNRVHAQVPVPRHAQLQVGTAPAPNPVANQPGVTVDLQGATVIRTAPVLYPPQAQAGNIQGTVYLELTIDQSGDVSDARVLSGPQALRRGALQSVLNWHFTEDAAGSTRQVSIAFQPSTIELQNQLTMLLYQQSVASARGAAQLQEKIDSLRATLGSRQQQAFQPSDFAGAFAGQPLGDIRILGVTDSERDQLLSQLPLFIRHPLTQDSIAASIRAVRQFDRNATARFAAMGAGQVAFIVQVR